MRTFIILTLGLLSTSAWAHHPMGGEAPQTIINGLLSGLAHPVIGIDHLAFVVLVGLAAAMAGRSLLAPLAFIGATLVGTGVLLAGVVLPLVEAVVVASVVLLGALLMLGRRVMGPIALMAFAVAGVFHGWAYGEAVIGATPMPIFAYLLGFGVIQFLIAGGIATFVGPLLKQGQGLVQARLAAAVCMGVGLVFAVEGIEQLLFV